ncbi:MAG: alpha/beta hydrolase [Paracoccaceae bacterium]
MTFVIRAILVCLCLYALVIAVLFLAQRQLQYFPAHKGFSPEAVGLTGVEVITLATPDGEQLQVWHSPAAAGQPSILYFHGNAGEISDRPRRFAYYQAEGFGVTYLSYRGFGGSTGQISEAGLHTDAQTAYDWLRAQDIPSHRIALVGESLGTGVAVQLAARNPVGAVALEAPYTSITDIAAGQYPFVPVHLLLKDQFRSIDHIASVKAPLLIQHGDQDRLIPITYGQRLFAAANEPKEFITLPGGGHDAMFDPTTWAAEAAFFRRAIAP